MLFPAHDTGAAGKKHKILCVDDETENLEILDALLSLRGYEVKSARDGRIALDTAAADTPDLILLDIVMPRMSGFEVLEILRGDEKLRFVPVVMVTALEEIEDRIRAIEAGCDDFISKPFNEHELIARIKSLLTMKALRDEIHRNYVKLKSLEETKDCLIHMIIHDMNNPLTVISGKLQFLTMELQETLTALQKEDIGFIFDAIQDLQNMTADILDVSKMEEGCMKLNFEDFKLGDLIGAVVEHLKDMAMLEKKTLSLEVAENMPDVSADKDLIRRVATNLITNALKFTEPGGSVLVKVSYSDGEYGFYVRVKDSGRGIPKEYVYRVFDKFFRVEAGRTVIGRGLGLTFCKMAVEAHGGRIWAESEGEGLGSTFAFTIPGK